MVIVRITILLGSSAAGLLNAKSKVNKQPGGRHFVPMTQQQKTSQQLTSLFTVFLRAAHIVRYKQIVRALKMHYKINKFYKIPTKIG